MANTPPNAPNEYSYVSLVGRLYLYHNTAFCYFHNIYIRLQLLIHFISFIFQKKKKNYSSKGKEGTATSCCH